MTPTSRLTAGRRSVGGAGTASRYGPSNCGLTNCCGNRSAGSAPGGASARGRQTWTTSWTTRATGRCSRIPKICKAFATAATAGKRWRECDETGRKDGGKSGRNWRLAWVWARTQVTRLRARRPVPYDLPPHPEKVWEAAATYRASPFVRKIFPTRNFGRASERADLYEQGQPAPALPA